MRTVVLVLACVVCNTIAQLALRQGAHSNGAGLAANAWSVTAWGSVMLSRPVLLGLVLWTISTLLWIYVLSHTGLALAYGLYGLNYLLVPLAAHWRFGETISHAQVVGMGFIALGVGFTVAGRGAA